MSGCPSKALRKSSQLRLISSVVFLLDVSRTLNSCSGSSCRHVGIGKDSIFAARSVRFQVDFRRQPEVAPEFQQDLPDVIHRTRQAGVKTLVAVTEEVEDFSRVLRLQERYPDLVAPCLGLHPLQAAGGQRSVRPQDLEEALPLFYSHRERLVAIGEVGLDFTPWCAPTQQDRDDQMKVFIGQLDVAMEMDLPVNVHSRSAAKVTIDTMRRRGISRALLHNFSGKPAAAMEAVEAGFFFSFPPAVCRNQQVRRVTMSTNTWWTGKVLPCTMEVHRSKPQ
uniref:TatD DNase domain containing 3 n=1 Tax=Poecilia reticulata TaxID=8081 RepID=A0A3P9PFT9_POERE